MVLANIYAPCAVSTDCLECPLSRCKWDDIEWFNSAVQNARRARVLADTHGERLPLREQAARLGVSERTVFRLRRDATSMQTMAPGDVRIFRRLAAQQDADRRAA